MADLHTTRTVYCGYPLAQRVERFFPNATETIKSMAIIKLADSGCVESIDPKQRSGAKRAEYGFLALASGKEERFAPHMGTEFLRRFGSLLSARLAEFY